MPDKANDPLPKDPDLSGTAEAIARGRELVKEAQRLREAADRQIEGVQATLEQADRALTRTSQILGDTSAGREPAPPELTSDEAE
jgi:hypothetical protein